MCSEQLQEEPCWDSDDVPLSASCSWRDMSLSKRMYACIFKLTCMRVCVRAHVCIVSLLVVCWALCVRARVYTYIYIYICVCMCVCVRVCLFVFVFVFVFVCLFIYLFVCICKHKKRLTLASHTVRKVYGWWIRTRLARLLVVHGIGMTLGWFSRIL